METWPILFGGLVGWLPAPSERKAGMAFSQFEYLLAGHVGLLVHPKTSA